MSQRATAKLSHAQARRRLHQFVLELLLRQDPMDLDFGGGAEAYGPDAEAVVAGLGSCRSEADVLALLYGQLQQSYGTQAAGDRDQYEALATAIWELANQLTGAS